MADGRNVNYGGKEINDDKLEFRVKREIVYNKERVFDRVRNLNYGDKESNGKAEFEVSREIGYNKERVFDRVRYAKYGDKEIKDDKEEFGVKREIGYSKERVFDRVRNVNYGDKEINDGKADFEVSREIGSTKGVFGRVKDVNYGDKEMKDGKEKFEVSREIGYSKEGVFDRVRNVKYGKSDFGVSREIGYNKEGVFGRVRNVNYGDKGSNVSKAEFEVSREIGYDKEGVFDRVRNDDMRSITDEVNGSGVVRGRAVQKDPKERVVMNGRPRSSDSGTSYGDDRMRTRAVTGVSVDREPGELSSESGSDGGFDSKSHSKDTKIKSETERIVNGTQNTVLGTRKRNFTPSEVKSETKRIENETQNTVLGTRKRNFTPIVWDMDDKEPRKNLKSSKSPSLSSQPPLPPIPKILEMPNLVTEVDVRRSPSPCKTSKIQMAEASLGKSNVEHDDHVSVAARSPVEQTPPPHEEVKLVNSDQAAATVADEESVPMRNIRSSRWANDADSPADEGEISADENPKIKKRRTLYDSVEIRGHRKSVTPNVGDLMREGSLGIMSRSSESDDLVKSSGRDSYSSHDIDENDHMDIDGDHHYSGGSASQSDAESKDDSDSCGLPEPTLPPQRNVNMLQGCRSVDEFERLNKINEGTYGVVYRAQDKKTGEIVALKKVKMEKEREGFPLTSLREINILLSFHHPSIIDVKEVVVGSSLDSIFMVMEYMEHDLKGLMETMKQPFSQSEVKCLMLQLLEGTHYLHDNWVLHRDLKTSNLLLNNCGELKICDFGLARQYGSPLKPYTQLVVTLWYRAPELLLGSKQYSTAIDMWSLGCIMAEFLAKEPLFSGKSEIEQIDKIYRILGTPDDTIWPGFSKLPGVKVNLAKHQNNVLRKKFPPNSFTGAPVLSDAGFDLLSKLLTYDPEKRITAEAALKHEWFNEVPLPKSKEFMPTFPALHAQDRRVRRVMKSPDPLEEQRRKELQQGSLGTGGVFG